MRTRRKTRVAPLASLLGMVRDSTVAPIRPVAQPHASPHDAKIPIHPRLAAVFRVLDESGAWLLIRGEDDLFRPAGDVDILVSAEQVPCLDIRLQASGFFRVLAPGHGSHRFYFNYSPDEDLWLKLDIVSDITFGPRQEWKTNLALHCLQSRMRRGPLWVPAPVDQAWLQLLHLFLDKGEIQPARVELARRAGRVISSGDYVAEKVDHYMGAGTAVKMLALVRSGDFADVPAAAANMRAAWTVGARLQTTARSALSRGLRMVPPTLQVMSGRGIVVGVMGPDGAGKTSLLRSLAVTLPVKGHYVYMGLWSTGPRDGLLRQLPGGRLGNKVVRIFRGSLAARYWRLRGHLVLLDRVPHDTLLPGSIDKSIGGRIAKALAFALGPEPDVLLVLDAPGEVMFARKGEHTVEILEGWRRAYLELAQLFPTNRVLDASQPLHLVRRDATAIVWDALVAGAEYGDPPRLDPGKRYD